MEEKLQSFISGVQIIQKKKIHDERGAIFHMLRCDDSEFTKFGEIYFSKILPGIVKGWHLHQKMTLNYFLIEGAIRLVLFDDRSSSETKGKLQELELNEQNSPLILIPPGIWNAFKGLGDKPSILANCATEPHDPNEIIRRSFDDPYFCYDWNKN